MTPFICCVLWDWYLTLCTSFFSSGIACVCVSVCLHLAIYVHTTHTMYLCAKSLQSCPTLCNPMDCSLWGSSECEESPGKSIAMSCLCPPPGNLSNPGIEPVLLCLQHWQADSLPIVPPGKPYTYYMYSTIINMMLTL